MISIEQPQIKVEGEEKKVAADSFMVPETNSFGHTFRDYDVESERKKTVQEFYRTNHIHQTYDFVKRMREEYDKVNRVEMSIWECIELLDEFIDDSDPDLGEPQIEHLLQTAEAIRKDYPDEDWLHLTGLIHDLGKVLLHPSFGQLPQWAVVGDTFPVGGAFDECNVHHKVAKKNKTTLPSAALFIIRYHSFYPLHTHGAYQYLMNDEDKENLKWLHIFNKYDLYSKSKVRIDAEKVKPYYLSLIKKVGISILDSLNMRTLAVLPCEVEMVRYLNDDLFQWSSLRRRIHYMVNLQAADVRSGHVDYQI